MLLSILRFSQVATLVAAGLLCSSLIGCGSSVPPGPARSKVTGKVSYKGQPVARGQIRFTPENGPFAQADIRDGKYEVDYKGGVPVGPAKVEIDSYVETGPETVEPDGTRRRQSVQDLPTKYNTASTLRVEITAKGKNEHNFDLSE